MLGRRSLTPLFMDDSVSLFHKQTNKHTFLSLISYSLLAYKKTKENDNNPPNVTRRMIKLVLIKTLQLSSIHFEERRMFKFILSFISYTSKIDYLVISGQHNVVFLITTHIYLKETFCCLSQVASKTSPVSVN